MNEYRDNLSRHQLNRLSELEGRLVDMARFGPSFKAVGKEWKKRSEQREESSVCRVPGRHERGQRDIVRETGFCVHFDDLLVVSSRLSAGSG